MRLWNFDSFPAQRPCLIWMLSVVLDMQISKCCVVTPRMARSTCRFTTLSNPDCGNEIASGGWRKKQCHKRDTTLQALKGPTLLSRGNIANHVVRSKLSRLRENVQTHRCILTCVTETKIHIYKWQLVNIHSLPCIKEGNKWNRTRLYL